MEKGEKGNQVISNLDEAMFIAFYSFHFSPFPFLLITYVVTSFG